MSFTSTFSFYICRLSGCSFHLRFTLVNKHFTHPEINSGCGFDLRFTTEDKHFAHPDINSGCSSVR